MGKEEDGEGEKKGEEREEEGKVKMKGKKGV